MQRHTLALVLLAISTTACTSWHAQSAPVPQVLEQQHPDLVRVTRQDHSQVDLSGPKVVDDSLVGQGNGRRTAIPLSDVSGIAIRKGDMAGSFGIFALLGAVAIGVIAASSAAGSD